MRHQKFARYFRYLKRVERSLILEILDSKRLKDKTENILKQLDIDFKNLLTNNRSQESEEEWVKYCEQFEEIIEYREYILFTNKSVSIDISYLEWRLKSLRNSINFIPLG